ncbi:DUF2281 domain-containing protein [Nostoc punctiforme]|uniref:DUF2281 domain-containing protein n=1 Tax=Nostoc punctiforme TaxID=272131 RepID=UPI000045BB2E|nr:DUF2281 domain-containing protein [Nostoc punctiforme]
MSREQKLLAKWHSLPQDKQEEVLDFVKFLHLKNSVNKTPSGERLWIANGNYDAFGERRKPLLILAPLIKIE